MCAVNIGVSWSQLVILVMVGMLFHIYKWCTWSSSVLRSQLHMCRLGKADIIKCLEHWRRHTAHTTLHWPALSWLPCYTSTCVMRLLAAAAADWWRLNGQGQHGWLQVHISWEGQRVQPSMDSSWRLVVTCAVLIGEVVANVTVLSGIESFSVQIMTVVVW